MVGAVTVAVGDALAVLATVEAHTLNAADMAVPVLAEAADESCVTVRAIAARFQNVLLANSRSCSGREFTLVSLINV